MNAKSSVGAAEGYDKAETLFTRSTAATGPVGRDPGVIAAFGSAYNGFVIAADTQETL
jgi:hypothetical protein